jgi:hypothetical protein
LRPVVANFWMAGLMVASVDKNIPKQENNSNKQQSN